MVDTEDLAGWMELGELLKVPRKNIQAWQRTRESNNFPYPIANLSMGPIFSKSAILRWWIDWQPYGHKKPGNPKLEQQTEEQQSA